VILAPPPPPPARVQVVAQEFHYALSRRSVEAGWTIIELRNLGEDAHDLRMRRVGGKRVYVWPLAQSGETVDREFKLLPGTYKLTCAVGDHSRLGMVATLHVR
jgi:plastocyanin